MSDSLLRADKEIEEIYRRNVGTVYRVCFAYMKNRTDAEDAVQETFFRLIEKAPALSGQEHEKAWLIRTASNICKNTLRHWWRKRESTDDHCDLRGADGVETDEVLGAVMALPERYKTAVYLHYYEGYQGEEIARMMKKPHSTVRNYLHEARAILRERLGEDFDEE